MEQGLTPAEISDWLPKFQRLSGSYAIYWSRKTSGLVDVDSLQSVAYEQAWKSLCSWRPSGGSGVINHVKRGMWLASKGHAIAESSRVQHQRHYEKPLLNFGRRRQSTSFDQSLSRMDDQAAGRQLMDLMNEILPAEIKAAVTRRLIEGEQLHTIARDMKVSREAVRNRLFKGLDMIRRVAMQRGILRSLHEPGAAAMLLA